MAEATLPGVRLRELVDLLEIRGCRVLAGGSGLGRRAVRVGVVEASTPESHVQAGELVLASGKALRNRSRLADLVRGLAGRGAAALVLRSDPKLPKVPRAALAAADTCELPLLEIAADMPWSTLIEALNQHLARRTAGSGDRVGRNLEQLIRLAANRVSVSELVQSCAQMTRTPLLVVDRQQSTVTGPFGGPVPEDCIARIVGALPWTSNAPFANYLLAEGRAVEYHGFPVCARAQVVGFLVAVVREGPVYPDDLQILEKAAELAGALFHLAQWPDTRFRDQFLQSWLMGILSTYGDVTEQARGVGLELSSNYYLLLVRPPVPLDSPSFRETTSTLRDFLNQHFASVHRRDLVGATRQGVVLLSSLDPRAETAVSRQRAEQDAAAIARAVQRRFPAKAVRVGIGAIPPRLTDLPHVFRETVEALEIAEAFALPQPVIARGDIVLFRLLHAMKEHPATAEFLARTITPLAAHDAAHGSDLVATLEAYLDTGNVGETARRLFTHYNTVRYRLQQIEKQVNMDLSHWETCLELLLALKLAKVARPSG